MAKNILFFDADGTLVGESRKVTEATKEAILKTRQNGNLVFLCTGRAPASIDQPLLDTGFDGVVASAGSLIMVNDQLIYENFINQYILSEIMLLFVNHKILFTIETKDYVYQAPGVNEFFIKREQKKFKGNLELIRAMEDRRKNMRRKPLSEFDLNTIPCTKVTFIAPNKNDFYPCIPFLEEFFNIVYFSKEEDDYLNGEIIQKHCTKGDGIKNVCNYFNVPIENSYAFGDSMNDYEMLIEAGHSYVSEYSSDLLKSKSDGIFIDPDKDGIALLLDELGMTKSR